MTDNMVNPNWQNIEKTLGYTFQNKALLVAAMTHRSYANECSSPATADNERLEFLGDAVLDLVVSEYLMASLPTSGEGNLTRIRADVVALQSLADLARGLGLGQYLLLGKGEGRSGGRDKPSLLANALEALFGAVFSDGGFAAARAVILPLFIPLLQKASVDEGQDYKTRLQELVQARRQALPVYRMTEAAGLAHERLYRVAVLIAERIYGTGEGRTKKTAEQNAAKAALASLEEEQ